MAVKFLIRYGESGTKNTAAASRGTILILFTFPPQEPDRNWGDLRQIVSTLLLADTRKLGHNRIVKKMLKAIIGNETRKLPPRLHDLVELADRAGVGRNEKQDEILRSLSECYKKTRYPDIMGATSRGISAEIARDYLHQTEPVIQWLLSMT